MSCNKIILVDDDFISLALVSKLLTASKICDTIEKYNNGKEAFDAISNIYEKNDGFPDLILLDINMPVWDGWDFLDELIKNNYPKKFKILMLSSSDQETDKSKSEKYDYIDGFITKPITIEKISNFI